MLRKIKGYKTSPQFTKTDLNFMSYALDLAKAEVGDVWPNPSVGCVITNNEKIVGFGATSKGGRPHAEQVAIKMAGKKTKGGVAYLTLEPCAHYGQTPPCADALLKAGIKKVIYSLADPDPRVSGRGEEILKSGGVGVLSGLLEEEAKAVNDGFFKKIKTGRPLVTLKFATSKDGKIATKSGQSKWITGESSRAFGHEMRAINDAILVGVGTVIADDPSLTCRIKGKEHKSPVRIVLDRHLRTPLGSKLVKSANEIPTWIVTEDSNGEIFEKFGVKPIKVSNIKDIKEVLRVLGGKGLTRLLVEGGSEIHKSFYNAKAVDKIAWFRAPNIIGNDGIPAIAGFDLDHLKNNKAYVKIATETFDEDVLEIYSAKE